jgi:hypothetical protein
MKASSYISLMVALAMLCACKREEATTWVTGIKAPLAKGSLSISDLLPEEYLYADADQRWHFRIEKNLTDFQIDSLVEIPDTTIHKALVLPFLGGPFTIPAGTEIYDQVQNNYLQTQGAQLKEVDIKEGFLYYSFVSYVNGELDCTCTLPGVTLNGSPIVLEATTAATANDLYPSSVAGAIDLSLYHIDFSGSSGNGYNQIESLIQVSVAADASAPAQVYGNDSIIIDLQFVDTKIKYGRGYFGQHHFDINETISFGENINLPQGQFLLNEASLGLTFRNFVGVDFQMHLDALNGIQNDVSTSLVHPPLFDWINFTRAELNSYNSTPSTVQFMLNENNSNLTDFIGNLPSQINLQGEIEINPLGNISLNNDFIFTDQTVEAIASLDIPLQLATNGITLRDTLLLSNEAIELIANGKLYLVLDNYFPLQVTVNAQLNLENQLITLLNEATLEAASASSPDIQSVRSIFEIAVTEDLIQSIRAGSFIALSLTLSTDNYPTTQALLQSHRVDYQLIGDGEIEVHYE